MENTNVESKALALMVICGFCWSVSSLLIKMCDFSGLQIVCFRAMLAGSFLFFYLTMIEKKKFIFNKNVLFVAIFVSFKYITFVSANKLVAAANTVALAQMSTVYILVANCIFLRTMPRKIDIWVIIATIIGMGLFFYGQFDLTASLGNVLAGIAGVCTAVMFFCSGRFKTFEENLSAIILGNFIAACITFFFIAGEPVTINTKSVCSLLFLAIVQQGIAFILYSKAIRVISSFACAIIATIEPILSPILVFLILDEVPAKYAIYGAVIVILSITIWSFLDYKIKENSSEVSG